MATNPYFNSTNTQGSEQEQDILEDLIIESIQMYGMDFFYIPRVLVGKNEILGEDRLSKFVDAYPIECYMETFEAFGGEGSFMDKFGLMIQQTATLTVARKRWKHLIGNKGKTILPNRPAEGDLMYFPLTKGLFEIMFVEDKKPFFQVGKLYTYKLQIELFNYSSEKIDTGITDIDIFEDKKSYDPAINPSPDIPDSYGDNDKYIQKKSDYVIDPMNPFSE